MHNEKIDPENHAQTAVAGPPADRGDPQLAGTMGDLSITVP